MVLVVIAWFDMVTSWNVCCSLDKAEQLYLQALAGKEKAFGLDHMCTLDTVTDLENLYRYQGELLPYPYSYCKTLNGYKVVTSTFK